MGEVGVRGDSTAIVIWSVAPIEAGPLIKTLCKLNMYGYVMHELISDSLPYTIIISAVQKRP